MDPNNLPNGSTNPQRMQYPVLAPGATTRATTQLANGPGGLQNGNGPSRTRPDGARLLNQLELSSENSEEGEEEFERFHPGSPSNGNAVGGSNSGPGPVRRTASPLLLSPSCSSSFQTPALTRKKANILFSPVLPSYPKWQHPLQTPQWIQISSSKPPEWPEYIPIPSIPPRHTSTTTIKLPDASRSGPPNPPVSEWPDSRASIATARQSAVSHDAFMVRLMDQGRTPDEIWDIMEAYDRSH
ncbi:hypothetical protein ACEPPN_002940 [Leptodophora sp. 'Broadleaf-Isolate-01']